MTRRRSECRVVFVIAAIAAITACSRQETQTVETARSAETEQAYEPPVQAFGSPDSAPRAAVLEYARAARYITDRSLTDEQGLLLRGAKGPTVRVEAVENSHRLSRERLARGALIARFISAGDYAPLGLRRGVHYVFADSARGWRTVIVPANAEQPVRVMQMALLDVTHVLQGPLSRFFEFGGLTFAYIRCGRICCIPCDPVGYLCPPGRLFPQLDSINPMPEQVLR